MNGFKLPMWTHNVHYAIKKNSGCPADDGGNFIAACGLYSSNTSSNILCHILAGGFGNDPLGWEAHRIPATTGPRLTGAMMMN